MRVITGIQQPQGIALDSADNIYYTESNIGRIGRVVRTFNLDPAKVTRAAQGTYVICPVIHRAAGFTAALEIQVEASSKINVLQLVQPGPDSSGAIEVRSNAPSIAIRVIAGAGSNGVGLGQNIPLTP